MTIMRTLLGPKSTYDKSLPFAYYAKVSPIEDDNTFLQHYFAETICGIIKLMDEKGIAPDTAELFGAYTHCNDKHINTSHCINNEGKWLTERETCSRFEQLYEETHENRYKGCVETGKCMFDDRNRHAGDGPF